MRVPGGRRVVKLKDEASGSSPLGVPCNSELLSVSWQDREDLTFSVGELWHLLGDVSVGELEEEVVLLGAAVSGNWVLTVGQVVAEALALEALESASRLHHPLLQGLRLELSDVDSSTLSVSSGCS